MATRRSRSREAFVTLGLTAAGLLAAGGRVLACPVCFGVSDSPMAKGMNAGIFVLLGVTATVLLAVMVVAIRIARLSGGEASGVSDPGPYPVPPSSPERTASALRASAEAAGDAC